MTTPARRIVTRFTTALLRWHAARTRRSNAKHYPRTSGAITTRRKP